MSKSSQFSRRSILRGVTATAALLGAARAALPNGAFAQGAGPETKQVKLGFIALTGVAGPSDQDGVKPGTLCVGLAMPDGSTQSRTLQLPGVRDQMRQLSVISALDFLRRALSEK